ncbi:MAG: hypothetical protein IJL69_05515 [Oscillospiraceae bacterium]|nr:hypothetical protein [Oscillospiraceae bacterium]
MKLRDFARTVKTNLSDTPVKRLVLRAVLWLLLTVVLAVIGSLLGSVTLGLWLRPLLERSFQDRSLPLCLSGYFLFALVTLFVAWRMGAARPDRPKLSVRHYFISDGAATLVFCLPAAVLYAIYSRSDVTWARGLIVYMPFLFLRRTLRFDALSVLVTAFALCGARTGLYALGLSRGRRRSRGR